MDSGLFNENSRKINDHDTDLTIFTKSNPPKMSEVVGGKEYVDQQITLITETGIPKFMCYTLSEEATEEGQTEFPINLETFDILTDTVRVYSGVTRLSPNRDFSVTENSVVLTRGVPLGRTIDIEVLKNVPMGEDGSVSGKVIASNSLPVSTLKKAEFSSYVQSLIDSGVINMSAIKSVQRGVITIAKGSTSGSATINSVNTSKAIVVFGGFGMHYETSYSDTALLQSHSYLTLESATKVTATRNTTQANIITTVPYQVIEYA